MYDSNKTFMKLIIKIRTFILFCFVFFFASCKKEEIKKEETIHVPLPRANRPPVANAGRDTTIILPVNIIQLLGDKSYDPDDMEKIAK